MAPADAVRAAGNDIRAALCFFTRLPVAWAPHAGRRFADALWAAPLAGVVVGAAGAGTGAAAHLVGLPSAAAAMLALAATMLVTGCLHEDGLADLADGFGGGMTRERRLEIMRDSRIGTFGAAALILSIGLRWSALASFGPTPALLWAMLGAHAASRALLPALLKLVPPARPGGLGAGVGEVPAGAAWGALLIGLLCLLPLGLACAMAAASVLALWFLLLKRLCEKLIGGQTGDVCGALQQGGEIAVLLAASAAF